MHIGLTARLDEGTCGNSNSNGKFFLHHVDLLVLLLVLSLLNNFRLFFLGNCFDCNWRGNGETGLRWLA